MANTQVQVDKQERENNLSLIRRFTRRLRESGILLSAKKSKFRKRLKSEQLRKRATLRRLEKQEEYKKMAKLGKV